MDTQDCDHPVSEQRYAGYNDGELRVYQCEQCGYERPEDPRDPGKGWAELA